MMLVSIELNWICWDGSAVCGKMTSRVKVTTRTNTIKKQRLTHGWLPVKFYVPTVIQCSFSTCWPWLEGHLLL